MGKLKIGPISMRTPRISRTLNMRDIKGVLCVRLRVYNLHPGSALKLCF